MRAHIRNEVLYIHPDDVPSYKKKGSVVRNSYFWAMRSIADRARLGQAWEYEQQVWLALTRMLTAFMEAGYLGYRETLLEFSPEATIPPLLKPIATWADPEEDDLDEDALDNEKMGEP